MERRSRTLHKKSQRKKNQMRKKNKLKRLKMVRAKSLLLKERRKRKKGRIKRKRREKKRKQREKNRRNLPQSLNLRRKAESCRKDKSKQQPPKMRKKITLIHTPTTVNLSWQLKRNMSSMLRLTQLTSVKC